MATPLFARINAANLPWAPSRLAGGLICWLKADAVTGFADGETIPIDTALKDSSETGHPMLVHDGIGVVTYQTNEINGLPVIRGDAINFSSCELHTGVMPGVRPTSISVALLFKNLPSTNDLWGEGEQKWIAWNFAGSIQMYAGTVVTIGSVADSGVHVVTTIFNGANSIGSVDGTPSATINPGTDAPSFNFNDLRFSVNNGGGTGHEFAFDLGEVIASSGAWNTADREIVEGYLAHKWGISGNLPGLHPYAGAGNAPVYNRPARRGLFWT